MEKSTVLIVAVVVSEIIAVFLIRAIWRSDDYRIMKVVMSQESIVALIPVIGTRGALWTYGFPSAQNRAYQNRGLGFIPTLEVFDRWRHVLDEKNEAKRRRAAAELLDDHKDD